jgi:hypothetical protein
MREAVSLRNRISQALQSERSLRKRLLPPPLRRRSRIAAISRYYFGL